MNTGDPQGTPVAEESTSLLHNVDSVCVEMEPGDQLIKAGDTETNGAPHCVLTIQTSQRSDVGCDDVSFIVGRDRQVMNGVKSEMAALSPVFKAMFEHDSSDSIEISDVEPAIFGILLRHAAQDRQMKLDDDNVWETLRVADKYCVLPLVDLCFTFLTQRHSRRKRSHHLCVVLEMAHRLNYTHHHTKLLHKVKQKAARVLRNQDAVGELCHQCMLDVVRADDLVGVDEIVVHGAVMTWTRCECDRQGRQSDSWEELRDVAGDLVQHVRYLTLSEKKLNNLRAGDPSSCLLTQKELDNLVDGDASYFPRTVHQRRNTLAFWKQTDSSWIESLAKSVQLFRAVFCYIVCITGLLLGSAAISWVMYSMVNSFVQAADDDVVNIGTDRTNNTFSNHTQYDHDSSRVRAEMVLILKFYNTTDIFGLD